MIAYKKPRPEKENNNVVKESNPKLHKDSEAVSKVITGGSGFGGSWQRKDH